MTPRSRMVLPRSLPVFSDRLFSQCDRNPPTSAGVRIQFQDVQRDCEDRACNHRASDSPDPGDDHVLQQSGSAVVEPGEANREDRNRNGRFHHLPDFQARVGGSDREDDAEEDAPADGARGKLWQVYVGRHDRRVRLPRFQHFIRAFGEGFGFEFGQGREPPDRARIAGHRCQEWR